MCGRTTEIEAKYCPYCGEPLPDIALIAKREHKTTQNLITTILLILYFPIGMVLMWVIPAYTLKTRWAITIALLVMAFLGFLMVILWTTSPGYMY